MQLEDILKQKVKQINEDKARRQEIKDWTQLAYGGPKVIKVISFTMPDKAYHLVFSAEKGVELREGECPSFNVSYRGSEENILKVLNGEKSASNVWQKKELQVWGGLSEAFVFEKLL